MTYEGDVEALYDRTFQADLMVFGNLESFDLKPNGRKEKLTNFNKQGNFRLLTAEFVHLYVDFVPNKSVMKQFSAFKEGFDLVCGNTAIQVN